MKDQMIYKPDQVAEQAQKLIDIGIENFKKRKGKATNPSGRKQNAVIGFSLRHVFPLLAAHSTRCLMLSRKER